MQINKNYEPNNIEDKWYKNWLENNYFSPEIDENKEPYTILIPPPNVTGILHMGHVLNNTIQDIAIRYKRMQGFAALWIPGTDHAGIATQNVVERKLAKENKTRHDIGREELINQIWDWKHEKGGTILNQLKKLGASCDWSKLRFTMDDKLSEAVNEVFMKLYEKGLIYKGKRIINWCPRCVTALANDEVEHTDEKGHFWHMKYPYKDGKGFLEIATTRPETMLGDTAVAVHPDDERYKDLIEKELILPLTDRTIPIIADEYVDKDFGTGCVKITPAHDPNDFQVGKRHNLEQIIVMDENAVMNSKAGKDFEGLSRFDARKKIIKMLTEQDLLLNTKDHNHSVGHCYRCDTVVEPYLSSQWFVKMEPLAKKAIEVVKNKNVKFQPERWEKVYYHWMENIRDWCISRQIWWGHRIPAYYCKDCGETVVAKNSPKECPKCKGNSFKQEDDVLDTWFSSWLWPFSTLGWPEKTKELDYFLPTNLLVTAPGIIFFWVARMIMSTLEFEEKIPFDTVLLHGMVLDEKGRKMSKSLGNSPDPIHIIEEYGADALRFGMIYNTPKGEDSYYSNHHIKNGRNFANKIWNAFRFIMMNAEKITGLPKKADLKLELADKWIYSRFNQVIEKTENFYEQLRFNDAAQTLMDFIWNDFCSWYLELSKDRIYNEKDTVGQLTAKYILFDVLQNAMRLLHPIMPFITEEIWQEIKKHFPMEEESIVIAKFPKSDKSKIFEDINNDMKLIQESISAIRNLRKSVNISPAEFVNISFKLQNQSQEKLIKEYSIYFKNLAKVEDIKASTDLEQPSPSIATVVQDLKIYLPLEGKIDLETERNKFQRKIDKLEKDLKKINGKLNNKRFVDNAPDSIVAKEKGKQTEVQAELDKNKEILSGLN